MSTEHAFLSKDSEIARLDSRNKSILRIAAILESSK